LVATKNVRNGPFNEEVDFFDFLAKIGHRTVRAYDTRYQVPGTSQKNEEREPALTEGMTVMEAPTMTLLEVQAPTNDGA